MPRAPSRSASSRYEIYRLDAVTGDGLGRRRRCPYSLKVLLENLLRTEDGADITADDIRRWPAGTPNAEPDKEIQFTPARVIMQDFTGVPCIVDLATMREAMAELGGDATKINPLAPAELVIDHSVIADVFGTPEAFERNVEIEYERNRERYQFLRWGQDAFDDFKVVPAGHRHRPPGQHRAPRPRRLHPRGRRRAAAAYPDTCVGTDSHTTMVNGLGVVGWGVGGIEAEAAMLGQPVSMLIPRVVGFKLSGELPEGSTATDLVLTITEMLRQHGVVGKFVEFYGDGVGGAAARQPRHDRQHEPGVRLDHRGLPDRRGDHQLPPPHRPHRRAARAGRGVRQGAGPLARPATREPRYSERLELDLGTVVPSIAGPKRPQDRIEVTDAKQSFRGALADVRRRRRPTRCQGVRRGARGVLPGLRLPAAHEDGTGRRRPRPPLGAPQDGGRPSNPADGDPRRRHGVRARPRRRGDRRDHVVHQHLEPVGDDRRGPAGQEGRREGPQRKPWVKTTLAPGSKVVSDYYEQAGLTPYLDKLGFNLVGYGCTTCIGNSGPLIPEVSEAVNDNDLAVVSVLSGNRNFEGRINPDVKMNYLASPPLVVAYALAGSMDVDLFDDPLGQDPDGNDVFLKDIWPSPSEVEEVIAEAITAEMFTDDYADVFAGDERWQSLPTPEGDTFAWDEDSTYVRKPPYFDGMPDEPGAGRPTSRARGCCSSWATRSPPTTSRPAGAIKKDSPGRQVPRRARRRAARLQLLRLAPRQPRGDDPRHVRQHPAAQPARAGHRGRLHPRPHATGGDGHDRLRGVGELPRRGHPAGRAGRQGVRLRLVARLGRQGHRAARA